MRLIFPETRHPGLQFEHKNEAIPIRIESDMIFRSWLYMLLQQLWKNRNLLAPHSHQSFHLMHQISPKAKMRSRFMILCQPSLNGLPFIFSPPLLYKPPSPSFQSTQEIPILSYLDLLEVCIWECEKYFSFPLQIGFLQAMYLFASLLPSPLIPSY